MKISTQRAIDRWVGQALCALLSVWSKLLAVVVPNAHHHRNAQPRILVILLSEMGSVVLAKAMFDTLKAKHPGAELHVLQLKKNQGVMRLLGFVPETNLHSLDDSSLGALLHDLWHTTRHLRTLQLDGVLDCELFSRISALLSYACGARVRVGFTSHTQEGLYRGSFINAPVPYNTYQHISLQFVGLAKVMENALAWTSAQLNDATHRPLTRFVLPAMARNLPQLSVDAAELQTFEDRLHTDFASFMGNRKRVLLYVSGGALPIRAWPEDSYIALAKTLIANGCAVGVIGLPEDTPQAQRVMHAVNNPLCIGLTGYTRNLRELLMLFHNAELLVTNDGGPGHFASLTPIDVIAFFGPETGRLYGPISERATVLESGMACSPCLTAYNHRDSFCDGDNQCLKVITVAEVEKLVLHKLQLI
ncbi:glycosyltransferase family 9 protein [Limnohabitans sp.]|uniref:glycosyltransferase family 9 protein n=1 Tax=Limnohabitans sp. TaxID=1907725 RepID=UPI00286F2F3D|nr:glycosyltransferase family 9 protein [Limnohabitans sp.]